MIAKLKECAACGEQKTIWKNHAGEKYCKDCWYKKEPIKSPKPKSDKKAALDGIYSKLRKEYLTLYPYCQARLDGCTANSTDIHHMKGRGVFYLDKNTWLSVCRTCHEWIERNPLEAKDLEFSKTRL